MNNFERIKLFIQEHLIIIVILGMLFPFLIISLYNHPSQDDYCQINVLREIGFWNYQSWIREKWGGRYTSYALSSFVKVIEDNLYIYKILPVIFFVLLFFAFYFLINQVFEYSTVFGLKVSLILMILYVVQYKSIAEGFYWMSSAVSYQLGNIITIFLAAVIIILQKQKNIFYCFVGVVGVFLLVGTNEVSMILVDSSLLILLFYNYTFDRKINYQILILFTVALVASYVVISAGGNNIRSVRYPNKHLFFSSSIKSLLQTIYSICLWIGLDFVSVLIIYREFLKDKVIFKFSKNINLKIIAFFCVILVCLGFFVGFWATGESLAHRARNVVYLFFLLLFLFCSFLFVERDNNIKSIIVSIPKSFYSIILISYFSFLFSKENINECFVDLMKHKAMIYDKEIKQRNIISMHSVDEKHMEFSPLSKIPKTLFVTDFKHDTNYHFNRWYAQFWGFKTVKLKCDE